jgi:hypothetical protein
MVAAASGLGLLIVRRTITIFIGAVTPTILWLLRRKEPVNIMISGRVTTKAWLLASTSASREHLRTPEIELFQRGSTAPMKCSIKESVFMRCDTDRHINFTLSRH